MQAFLQIAAVVVIELPPKVEALRARIDEARATIPPIGIQNEAIPMPPQQIGRIVA